MSHDNPKSLTKDEMSLIQLADVDKISVKQKRDLPSIPIDESLLKTSLDELNKLIGMTKVKAQIAEMVNLVRYYRESGRDVLGTFYLHTVFIGNPGTGKTTVATTMAEILHRLGYLRTPRLVSVTRDDLVGEYIGHTAPKTKAVLKRAMGGVLLIDEAYYLHRPENERDYGTEAIEILMQVMEDQRDDLVVIVAGYADRMETFLGSNPGLRSRVAHHIEFPDYTDDELVTIGERMLASLNYRLTNAARTALFAYVARRKEQPHFANARSIRNALDRARLRQAGRHVDAGIVTIDELMSIDSADLLASRVFTDRAGFTDG